MAIRRRARVLRAQQRYVAGVRQALHFDDVVVQHSDAEFRGSIRNASGLSDLQYEWLL